MRRTVLFVPMGFGGRERRRAVALALAVVLAACSSGGDGEGDDALVGDGADPTTTTAGADEPRSDGRPTTTARGGTTSTTAGRGSGATTTTAGATDTTRATTAADTGARGVPGAYARTLLQPHRAPRIVVELLVQQGAGPVQGTVDHVLRELREASGKPVAQAATVSLPAGDGTTTDAEVRELADRHGRAAQGSEQAVVRLLFLNGRYDPTTSVLGVAVRGDTAAVFSQQVRNAATPLVSATALEDAVTTHELGHLLGLVDLVLATGREDPQHKGHSRNRGSVMYWAIESSLVGQVLDGPPPRGFDDDDRDDLAAIRSGG